MYTIVNDLPAGKPWDLGKKLIVGCHVFYCFVADISRSKNYSGAEVELIGL